LLGKAVRPERGTREAGPESKGSSRETVLRLALASRGLAQDERFSALLVLHDAEMAWTVVRHAAPQLVRGGHVARAARLGRAPRLGDARRREARPLGVRPRLAVRDPRGRGLRTTGRAAIGPEEHERDPLPRDPERRRRAERGHAHHLDAVTDARVPQI